VAARADCEHDDVDVPLLQFHILVTDATDATDGFLDEGKGIVYDHHDQNQEAELGQLSAVHP